ncbi:MAG TPA: hypothetical protein VJA26_10850 [Gammaproteobacteria bacterium]|nr:hypothetical protein [Gammaproteobacteria bacterium]
MLRTKSISWKAIDYLCVALLVGTAAVSSAQQAPSANQQEIERIRAYLDPLRGARLVGSNDSLAIELPNGELRSLAGCLPPVSRGGVIKVDCTLDDGPAHYFDESTRAMIESCSFWFADPKRCPPKRWPLDLPGCDGTVPEGITGTWRFYASPAASGFSPTTGGWTMTLAEGSMSFDFYGTVQIERSYTVVQQSDRRYALEIRDDSSATTAIDIELAPCGILVEANAVCDAFCENIASEFGAPTDAQLRAIVANSLGDRVDEDTLERILETARELEQRQGQQPQPLFPERAYFREVIDD